MALQFFQAGGDADMAEEDGEQQDAPEDRDGIVVAAATAMESETLEELGIGYGSEEGADGDAGGIVFEAIPGEERFGDGDEHK